MAGAHVGQHIGAYRPLLYLHGTLLGGNSPYAGFRAQDEPRQRNHISQCRKKRKRRQLRESRGGRRSRKQLLRQFLPSLFPPIRLAVLPGRLWVDHPASGRLQELKTDGKASAAERLAISHPRSGAEITRKRGKRQVIAGLPAANGNYT